MRAKGNPAARGIHLSPIQFQPARMLFLSCRAWGSVVEYWPEAVISAVVTDISLFPEMAIN